VSYGDRDLLRALRGAEPEVVTCNVVVLLALRRSLVCLHIKDKSRFPTLRTMGTKALSAMLLPSPK